MKLECLDLCQLDQLLQLGVPESEQVRRLPLPGLRTSRILPFRCHFVNHYLVLLSRRLGHRQQDPSREYLNRG